MALAYCELDETVTVLTLVMSTLLRAYMAELVHTQVRSLAAAAKGLATMKPNPRVPVEKEPLAQTRCLELYKTGKSGMQASGPVNGLARHLA